MPQTTDLQPRGTRPLTEEHRVCAGWVLGTIADTYGKERPTTPVDLLDFPVRVGAEAYRLVGESCHGGTAAVSRAAIFAVGEVEDGLTRGELALRLRRSAEELGCEWDDNGPVIPKVPGPRRSTESLKAGLR
jgi:hypothetical protein